MKLGFSVADLDGITMGLFFDVCAISSGDEIRDAGQDQIDALFSGAQSI